MRRELESALTPYQFQFSRFQPDPDLKKRANLKLVQLLVLAPPGARASGRVETLSQSYLSSVEIRSPYREFRESAVGLTPEAAIDRVLNRIEERLYRWRFGGGGGETSTQAGHRMNLPQTQG
jgi:hypothetical protein